MSQFSVSRSRIKYGGMLVGPKPLKSVTSCPVSGAVAHLAFVLGVCRSALHWAWERNRGSMMGTRTGVGSLQSRQRALVSTRALRCGEFFNF